MTPFEIVNEDRTSMDDFPKNPRMYEFEENNDYKED